MSETPSPPKRKIRSLARATSAALLLGGLWTGMPCPVPAAVAEGGAGPSAAQAPASDGEDLTVYLLTMGPGDQVWERFGHNALWIRDHATGEDAVYNWGVFDFSDDDFLVRFLQGDMEYWVERAPLDWTVESYRRANRSVRYQELALTPEQRAELRDFAQWNIQPENRYYDYDYFRDNCSTRVRDALDEVLGGAISDAFSQRLAEGPGRVGEVTYRWHARRLVQHDFVIDTGMHILLGPRGDRPITAWEEMFIPMALEDHLRELTVPDGAGGRRPLVVEEDTIFQAQRLGEPAEAPPFRVLLLLLGAFVGVVFPMLGIRAGGGNRRGAVGLALLGLGWSALAGFFGTLMALGWAWTDHVFMHGNENLFQMNPFSLLPAVLVPLAMIPLLRNPSTEEPPDVPRRGFLERAALASAVVVASLSAIGFLLQVHPAFQQQNGDVIALALPAHLGLVWGLRRVEEGRRLRAGAAAAERVEAMEEPVRT